jgi:hypothetical protein
MATTDLSATHETPRRRLLTVTGVTAIAFTLSWAAGLSVPAPEPGFTASGAELVAALAGHGTAVAAQFALTEGRPAVGLAVVSLALARAVRRSGATGAAGLAGVAGVTAAVISLVQLVLGVTLAGTSAAGSAHLLYELVNRLDGVKMFALGAVGLATATMAGVLPRWLRGTGIALALAMVSSGVPYLLLPGGAVMAYVSGPLLLLFITGTGLALSLSAAQRPAAAEPAPPARRTTAPGARPRPSRDQRHPGARYRPVASAGWCAAAARVR